MRATSGWTGGRWERVRQALGVSRVARVTGLDRTGVEVACAVRPGGHVLQVTNGKGLRFADALGGALMEAAELTAAERVRPADLRWASAGELAARGVPVAWPEPSPPPPDPVLAWREAVDLVGGGPVLVPAAAVHVPPAGGPLLGCAEVRWTSNGMGAHPRWEAALRHALLEAVERDDVARALPAGWTAGEVARRRVPDAAVAARAPRAGRLLRQVERAGLEAHLFALGTWRGGPATAAALLFDAAGGAVPLTAGYACRLDPESALQAALLEAAQSRLTDIHGAREDVAHGATGDVELLREACARARRAPGRGAFAATAWRVPAAPRRGVAAVLAHLRRRGHHRCAALDLAGPELPVRVAKVIVPGLRLSELL